MKKVLLPVHPEWVEKIFSDDFRQRKTIEVRTKFPSVREEFEVLIYCTKGSKELRKVKNRLVLGGSEGEIVNGTVVGSCRCPGYVTITNATVKMLYSMGIRSDIEQAYGTLEDKAIAASKVSVADLLDYANGRDIYGWCLEEATLFGTPKRLKDFVTNEGKPVSVPQSYIFVKEEKK